MRRLRLLIDAPLSGPVNMARDEVLLRAMEQNASADPVLRLYAWSPPTISLGYFQELIEFREIPAPAGSLDVVRRTTGGGAILHDLEVTYSLTMRLDDPLITTRPNRLYELAHRAIINAMGGRARLYGCGEGGCDASSQRGPFFCFERRHGLDVVIDGPEGVSKIAGSAQRRGRSAVLQHGSIMLDNRFPQQTTAVWKALDPTIDFGTAAQRLVGAFESVLEMRAERSEWQPAELSLSPLFESQYAGSDWTEHRKRTAIPAA